MMSVAQTAVFRCLLATLLWVASGQAWAADLSPPLVLEATIPLPHTSGRIDHMAVDLRRGWLFVAELGNGTLDVIDIAGRHVVQRVSGFKDPQGVGYSPAADIVSVASAGDGSFACSGARTFLRSASSIWAMTPTTSVWSRDPDRSSSAMAKEGWPWSTLSAAPS